MCISPSGKISVEGRVIYCFVISMLRRYSYISVIAEILKLRVKHVNMTVNIQLKLPTPIWYSVSINHSPLESKSRGFQQAYNISKEHLPVFMLITSCIEGLLG